MSTVIRRLMGPAYGVSERVCRFGRRVAAQRGEDALPCVAEVRTVGLDLLAGLFEGARVLDSGEVTLELGVGILQVGLHLIGELGLRIQDGLHL